MQTLSHIFSLQVASLQSELAMVQNQLMNSRFAFANALQSSQQQQHQQQQHNVGVLQPAYSNNSSASNNLINMSSFTSNFELAPATADTTPSSQSLEPLQLSRPSHDEEDDEEESRIPHVFSHEILRG